MKLIILGIIGIGLLFVGGVWLTGWRLGVGQLVEGLVTDSIQVDGRSEHDRSYVKRDRFIKLKENGLARIAKDSDEFSFELFRGETIKILIKERQSVGEHDAILFAQVVGEPGGEAILSIAGAGHGGPAEALAGTIDLGDGRSFKIEYMDHGVHRIEEINSRAVCQSYKHDAKASGMITAPNGQEVHLSHIVHPNGWGMTRNGHSYSNVINRLRLGHQNQPAHKRMRISLRTSSVHRNGIGSKSVRISGRIPGRIPKGSGRGSKSGNQFRGSTRPVSASGGFTAIGGGNGFGYSAPYNPGGESGSADPEPNGRFDILFVYTSGALGAKGGLAGVRSTVGLAIGQLNKAFDNSGITAKAHIAGIVPWRGHVSTDATLSRDILALMKDRRIKELRNRHQADLVHALVRGPEGPIKGTGALLKEGSVRVSGNISLELKQRMIRKIRSNSHSYSITKIDWTTHDYYFVHEIGHNLGANHNREINHTAGLFNFSNGWRFTGDDGKRYRTIMSYQDPRYPFERKALHFSNPRISYRGELTGTREADNAQTIMKSIATVSHYR